MGDKGPSSSTQAAETQTAAAQTAIAQDQNRRSDALFDASFPGFKKAEDYYTTLSRGDPNAIFRAIAPGTNILRQQTEEAKKSINDNMPRGGERNLALEEADISTAGKIGMMGTQAYLGSFPALAELSNRGIGLSLAETQSAIAAFGGASNTLSNQANQQAAGKAAQLGFFGSLAGAGAEAFAAA